MTDRTISFDRAQAHGHLDYALHDLTNALSAAQAFADILMLGARERSLDDPEPVVQELISELERVGQIARQVRHDAHHEYADFVTWVSHEVSEPARSAETLLEYVQVDGASVLPSEIQEMITRAKHNVKRVNGMLRGLREMETLQTDPALEAVDVESVLEGVLAIDLAELIRLRGARIDRLTSLPPAGATGHVVRTVLCALVANAVDHNPSPSPVVEVSGDVLPTGEREYTVRDTGPGVPPEWRERVFRVYARGPSTPRDAPSVGIGLTLARRALDTIGARIRIVDPPTSRGLQVCFTLPPPQGLPARKDEVASVPPT